MRYSVIRESDGKTVATNLTEADARQHAQWLTDDLFGVRHVVEAEGDTGPTCPHGVCSQNYIDTGNAACLTVCRDCGVPGCDPFYGGQCMTHYYADESEDAS